MSSAGHHTTPRRARRRLPTALTALALAVLTSACQWFPLHVTPDNRATARPCAPGIANTVRIDPARFTAGQVADMVAAVEYLRDQTSIPFAVEVKAVPAADRRGIVVRQGVVRDPTGLRREAFSMPLDDDKDGLYDRGTMLFDDYWGGFPTGRRWGQVENNFFKLAVHEFSHQVGLGDLYLTKSNDRTLTGNIMYFHHLATPGPGDYEGWRYLGCPGGPLRAR